MESMYTLMVEVVTYLWDGNHNVKCRLSPIPEGI